MHMLRWPPPTLAGLRSDFRWDALLETPITSGSEIENAVENVQRANARGCLAHDTQPLALSWGTWTKSKLYTDISGAGHFTLALLAHHHWAKMCTHAYRSCACHRSFVAEARADLAACNRSASALQHAVLALRAVSEATTHEATWPLLPPGLHPTAAKLLYVVILDGALEGNCRVQELAAMWCRLEGADGPLRSCASAWQASIKVVLWPLLTVGLHPYYCIAEDWRSPFPAQSIHDREQIAQSIADAVVLQLPHADRTYRGATRATRDIIGEAAHGAICVGIGDAKLLETELPLLHLT